MGAACPLTTFGGAASTVSLCSTSSLTPDAAYATVTQLVILVLLVRQMEATRTPSTLAKVSLWSIVIILLSDAWMFSAHAAIGLVSDNKASLPMLVPGFFGFCTVFVFGVVSGS